jgi:SOS-response transcriptional repressor LexA
VRTLLSLAGAGDALPRLIETGRLTELPSGCEIRVELEAVELLARLIPRGKSEVQRAYRELRALRGVRPTAGELYRMGFLPSSVRDGAGGWFDFVASEGDLEAAESAVLEAARSWFAELERTAMTKSFKMVVLDVLLEADALATGLTLAEIAARCHERLLRSPELLPDLEGVQELQPDPSRPDPEVWEAYWRKNPIAAWTSTPQQRPWFAVEADRFVPRLPTAPGAEETFARMTREVVDYRLARYRRGQGGRSGFECKVTWNQRDPILKLPARAEHPDLPDGETDVRLPDGALWRFRLAREFCNVARPVGTDRNQLPDLMRRWFGVAAGKPGTGFHVRFSPSPDGWWLEPAEAQVIELPARGRVIAFPSLRAAAGAAAGAVTAAPDSEEVALPIREGGEEVFAIRATGDSMDGGRAPIRDGDWLVMRYARGANVAGVEGRVALVETANALEGGAFQVKRVVRAGSAWQLRSDNPARPSYEASAAATVIASLVEVVRPESLGPAVGTTLAPEDMGGAFGVSGAVVTGRVDGHLFLCVEDATALVAPDRLRVVVADRRPGETAFVLLRGAEGWRYCGVARWRESEELWDFPALDYASWRALGKGRSSSRTLPPGAMEQAEALIARVLEPGPGYWIADGERRCRVVGAASKGGLRIDGGAGGFGERTVSVIDIGWVLVAQEECRLEGGILDEARVNRRRYLEGTPKGATRWIDTRWAIVLARGTREGAGT